jgi:hypothetical protein
VQGYREMVDWMFSSDPQAVTAYAKWAGVSESVARRTRDDFILKQNALPDRDALPPRCTHPCPVTSKR